MSTSFKRLKTTPPLSPQLEEGIEEEGADDVVTRVLGIPEVSFYLIKVEERFTSKNK
jgi:hypothetical protein